MPTGRVRLRHLAEVQRRREWPTRVTQAFGAFGLRLIRSFLRSGGEPRVPWFARVVFGFKPLARLFARMLAFGLWRVHVEGEPV